MNNIIRFPTDCPQDCEHLFCYFWDKDSDSMSYRCDLLNERVDSWDIGLKTQSICPKQGVEIMKKLKENYSMKYVYVLEVNCDFVGVYESREKAIFEGLHRYIMWLNSQEEYYVNEEEENHYPTKSIIDDLNELVSHGYIEDYIYINEVPFYGSDSE